jgi:hypothetical protein
MGQRADSATNCRSLATFAGVSAGSQSRREIQSALFATRQMRHQCRYAVAGMDWRPTAADTRLAIGEIGIEGCHASLATTAIEIRSLV